MASRSLLHLFEAFLRHIASTDALFHQPLMNALGVDAVIRNPNRDSAQTLMEAVLHMIS